MHTVQALLITCAACLVASTVTAQERWSIVEDKSPTNNGHQLSAAMVVADAALILRCRDHTTEVAFSTKDIELGDGSVTIRYRINSESPIREIWRSSVDGRAAFAPNPVDFMRSLPDSGRVFIRAITADGQNKDVNFKLSGVSELREKIGHACNWSSEPDESTTGTTSPPQGR
jgi:hypothetical protein